MNKSTQNLLDKLEDKIKSFATNPNYPHDNFVLITLHEAIAAAKEGNFGIGAVLVHESGDVIQRGRNNVFTPYFRSDSHAEMVVMTEFEKHFRDIKNLNEFILFSSLEPCPMCLCRLIISGIKRVYYATSDKNGGMVNRFKDMPPKWKELAKKQDFDFARCSSELKDIALRIFQSTADENNSKLKNR